MYISVIDQRSRRIGGSISNQPYFFFCVMFASHFQFHLQITIYKQCAESFHSHIHVPVILIFSSERTNIIQDPFNGFWCWLCRPTPKPKGIWACPLPWRRVGCRMQNLCLWGTQRNPQSLSLQQRWHHLVRLLHVQVLGHWYPWQNWQHKQVVHVELEKCEWPCNV